MLNLISSKVTGTPGASGWSQVHEFAPEDPEKLRLRGHLYAVMATSRTEEGVETVIAGRELLSRLHEEYFGDLASKPFNALENATQKVLDEFKESWGNVEVAACAIVDGVVYSSAGGGAGVVICRDGALATILESGKEKVASASGFPKSGDVLMLATKTFFENIPNGVIKAALQSPDPESTAEVFAPNVHGREDSGSFGAVIVRFEEQKTPQIEEIAAEEPKQVFQESKPKVNFQIPGTNVLSRFIRRIPERKIYIKPEVVDEVTSKSKKLTFTVAIFLLVILAVSIGFGIRQKKINEVKKQYQGILSQASAEVDQAISLASVSPDKSRELFMDSEQKLIQIKALKVKDSKIDDLEKKINDSKAAILGEYEEQPQLFLDLSLLSSGFKGDSISYSGGNIYVLDKNGKKVVSVVESTKKSKVVAGPGVIDQASDLTSYEDRVFILSSDGIYEVSSTKDKVIDKTWAGDALIEAFAANLYVLDKSGNAIYRYAGTGNTFGDKQNWLAVGANLDFSDALSWAIDGAVYVLYPNSKIQKFSQGSPQNFSLKGVVPEIGTVNAISADPDNQDLYFLDRAGNRVVVTDKKGVYKAQYTNGQISNATSLVVSEADKKIILLTGDKLLSLDIKNQ